ncbi:ROK family transcriptional regulator [Lentisphaerota bacterium ZTH]|nr:ROK family transcriptional regulator [Lentisphaerota bacterium]WET07530.1 ROK family transcriptional regulator [Lentisphaerota bacterium ZTH]
MVKIFNVDNGKRKRRGATPSLARQINIREVLDHLRHKSPLSRAELTRMSGVSAPTMQKLLTVLLDSGLIREVESEVEGRGRPSKSYTLSGRKIQVFGAVVGVTTCKIFTAPLSLELRKIAEYKFPTPDSYDELIGEFRQFMLKQASQNISFLGLGISIPGLVNTIEQNVIVSPNIHYLDGSSPATDMAEGLDLQTLTLQEQLALCLAEQNAGSTDDCNNFVVIDLSNGMGMGIMNNGGQLNGKCGYAGELGHIVVAPGGPLCGCGKHGCLESVASDFVLQRKVSEKVGYEVSFTELEKMLRNGSIDVSKELDEILDYLGRGISMTINILNPGLVLLNGRIFEMIPEAIDIAREKTAKYAMAPGFKECMIKRTKGNRDAGVLMGISNLLVDSISEIE